MKSKNIKIDEVLKKFEALTYSIENDSHSEEKLLTAELKKSRDLSSIKLSLTECHFISCLGVNPNVNGTFISKELNITKGGTSKAASKLLKKKLIVAEKLPNNKKEIIYSLTDLGERVYNLHEQMHQKAQDQFLTVLNKYTIDELDSVIKFLGDCKKHIITG